MPCSNLTDTAEKLHPIKIKEIRVDMWDRFNRIFTTREIEEIFAGRDDVAAGSA